MNYLPFQYDFFENILRTKIKDIRLARTYIKSQL